DRFLRGAGGRGGQGRAAPHQHHRRLARDPGDQLRRPRARVTSMILGIGNDIIDIRRVEKSIARFGERFLSRVFTGVERAKSDRRAQRAASYAKRFAAKEACAKALGTGLNKGVFWRDMGVVNLPSGKPTLKLTGGALKRLQAITPPGMVVQIDLTITDDFPQPQAYVIISVNPA